MLKVFAFLPTEILGEDLRQLWARFNKKLHENYKNAWIMSTYTGEGSLDVADIVVFLYEFKDHESVKIAVQKCKDLNITYNFYKGFYSPDEVQ